MENADVIVWCVSENTSDIPYMTLPKDPIIVYTKADISKNDKQPKVCALTGEGIQNIIALIEHRLSSIPVSSEDALALLPRHEQCLQESLSALEESLHHIHTRELTADSLRTALNAVGVISGKVTPDDILGEVFSTFCIGK